MLMLTGGRRPVVGDINMLTLKRAARTHMHPHRNRNRRRLTYTPKKKQERTSRKMLNTSWSFSVTMSLCCFNTCTKDVVFVIFPGKEFNSVFKCTSRRVRIMTPLMLASPLKCFFYLAEAHRKLFWPVRCCFGWIMTTICNSHHFHSLFIQSVDVHLPSFHSL